MERPTKIEQISSKKLLIELGDKIDRAFTKAVENALLEHKRAGNPIAVWRGDKIVLIQPEEITLNKI
jgi:hypothetical protein